ncbi:MAG: transglycosylase family protein [Acidimicrobiales bacterium]|nr:transglycosylase family protein [Actinomycetota bacterium]
MTVVPRNRIGVVAVLGLLALAAGTTQAIAGQVDDKRSEAAVIADQLEAQAQRIVSTDAEHRRAVDELARAEANVAHAEAELAATDRRHHEAKARLVLQAQDAYVVGGSISLLQYLVRTDAGDQVARRAYLRVMTGQDRRAIGLLRATREDLQDMRARLQAARQTARAKAQIIEGERAELDRVVKDQQATLQRVNGEVADLVEAEQARRDLEEASLAAARLAAARPAPADPEDPAPAGAVADPDPEPAPEPIPAATGDTWDCIRQLESGNNYATPGGGAYQFLDSTWQSLGYTGTASDAPPHVQDEAAVRLQARSGWSQWTTAPLCGRP